MSPSMWCINAFLVSSGTPAKRSRLAKVCLRLWGPDKTLAPAGSPDLIQAFFQAELCIRPTGLPAYRFTPKPKHMGIHFAAPIFNDAPCRTVQDEQADGLIFSKLTRN